MRSVAFNKQDQESFHRAIWYYRYSKFGRIESYRGYAGLEVLFIMVVTITVMIQDQGNL